MKRGWLLAAVLVAAAGRLLLQNAALPPYAGMDEVYHVARLAFVLQEGRDPNIREHSIPPYLHASTLNAPGALPSFGLLGEKWPAFVRERKAVLVDRELTAADLRPYQQPNYEAQQAPLYYRVVAPFAHLLPHRTPIRELQLWRLLSVFFALVTVWATARIGEHFYGSRGVLAALLLPMLPTWLTLVIRAGNDGLACALLACALMMTIRGGPVAIEALMWAAALATKLYTWPVLIVALFFWVRRAGSPAGPMSMLDRLESRSYICLGACALSVGLTVTFLATHTRNPIGLFGFDAPQNVGAGFSRPGPAETSLHVPIAYGEMLKITLASAVWTSGQHADALRLPGMLLYALPLIAVILLGLARAPQRKLVLVALATFGAAQIVNAAAFVRQAHAAGIALPLGGKEGWYWYALAPLLVAIVFPRTPLKSVALWLFVWDVVINQCQLFGDFAGATSPATPSFLFRWGPMQAPHFSLEGIGVGPFAGALFWLSLVHAAATLAAFRIESANDR
ncbi:MAG: hypothetical protein JOZ54_19400 [Acidobacteria bacterium]|nr:hypothetical protein [Acidobacteriota bacterium]